MANPYKEKVIENKKVKTLRIICAVLFFVEVILTTFPFVSVGGDETVYIEEGIENGACWSALEEKDEYECNNVEKISYSPSQTDPATPDTADNVITVYFTDRLGWNNVNVNYFSSEGEWKKMEMSLSSDETQSPKTYSAYIPGDSQGIIFDDRMDMTAFQLVIQLGGYKTKGAVSLALLCAPFLILPLAGFFFMLLSKKSYFKYFVSGLCCIVCSALITFGIGADIAIGALVSIFVYILILFLTVVCFVIDYGGKNSETK